jgi:hypothetical protein
MKTLFALSFALFAAACATEEPQQLAQAECKVAPITTKSVVNKAGPSTDLDRRWAEAQLASTGYRRQELQRFGENGAVESALRDCARN